MRSRSSPCWSPRWSPAPSSRGQPLRRHRPASAPRGRPCGASASGPAERSASFDPRCAAPPVHGRGGAGCQHGRPPRAAARRHRQPRGPTRAGQGTVWSVLRLPPPLLPTLLSMPPTLRVTRTTRTGDSASASASGSGSAGLGLPLSLLSRLLPAVRVLPAVRAVSAATGSRVRPARPRDASALDHGPVLPGRRVQRQRCRVARDRHRRVAFGVPGRAAASGRWVGTRCVAYPSTRRRSWAGASRTRPGRCSPQNRTASASRPAARCCTCRTRTRSPASPHAGTVAFGPSFGVSSNVGIVGPFGIEGHARFAPVPVPVADLRIAAAFRGGPLAVTLGWRAIDVDGDRDGGPGAVLLRGRARPVLVL